MNLKQLRIVYFLACTIVVIFWFMSSSLAGELELKSTTLERGGIGFSLSNTNLNINTTRRLHYGLLSKEKMTDVETGKDVFKNLVVETKMLTPQSGFFDLKQFSLTKPAKECDNFVTSACTSFAVGDIGGLGKEYLLYTEFDRFSFPAVMNYASLGGLALDIATRSSAGKDGKGAKFIQNVGEQIKNGGEFFDKVYNATQLSITTYNYLLNTIDLFLYRSGEEIEYPVKEPKSVNGKIVASIRKSVAKVNTYLGQLESVKQKLYGSPISKTPITNFFEDAKKADMPISGLGDANSLYKELGGIAFNKSSGYRGFSGLTSRNIYEMIVEAFFSSLLEPFSIGGKFYYPKSIYYSKETGKFVISDPHYHLILTEEELKKLAEDGNYLSATHAELARIVVKSLTSSDKRIILTDDEEKKLNSMAKAVIYGASKKGLSSMIDYMGSIEKLEKLVKSMVDLNLQSAMTADYSPIMNAIGTAAVSKITDLSGDILYNSMFKFLKLAQC